MSVHLQYSMCKCAHVYTMYVCTPVHVCIIHACVCVCVWGGGGGVWGP